MPIERQKICKLVSVKKYLNCVNTYTCSCCFNEAVQVKRKKLDWHEILYFLSNNLIEEKTYICFYKKKVIICCLKKLFSAKKIDVRQYNFYGNADRECLSDYLCLHFFEENDYNDTVFDYFCRQFLYYALNAVSYLLYNFFLEEKCN